MVTLEGVGLFTGERARVTLERRAGAAVLVKEGREVELRALALLSADHTTTVGTPDGALRVGTVEHLFAALAGLGVHDGIAIDCGGAGELPLLDGGARAWASAVRALEIPRASPALVVARDAAIELGASRYEFARGAGVRVRARIDYGDARIAELAEWEGDPADFVERIAPARTFAMAPHLDAIPRAHVAPESVVVVTPDAVLSAGERFLSDEPARHKLLDLLGDLYLHGGPPRGVVRSHRPGHAATHAAIRRALDEGILVAG
jgi:UDP-3-O-[3-hydroxymyristoyl] N-acetylglucosamine deacetylase